MIRSLCSNLSLILPITFLLASCATEYSPPCRRVSAQQFMAPHTFKGFPTDQFIGTTKTWPKAEDGPHKAFKQIWQLGWVCSWAIIWCPVDELPADFLKHAHEKPYRLPPGASDFIHE